MNELTISLDGRHQSVPLYEQIYKYIKVRYSERRAAVSEKAALNQKAVQNI